MKEEENLSRYLKEISKFKLLTAEEELLLFRKIKANEEPALTIERIIKANLRFVVSEAKKFKHESIPLEDFICEGNLGLIHAIEKFDETLGFRFLTYASSWIHKYIQEAIYKYGRQIRLPGYKIDLYNKIEAARKLLQAHFKAEPDLQDLSEYLGMDESEINDCIKLFDTPLSFDDLLPENKEGLSIGDALVGNSNADYILNGAEKVKEMQNKLSSLTENQNKVISLYHGFDSDGPLNLEQIADRLKISASRARQLKDAGHKKLKKIYLKTG